MHVLKCRINCTDKKGSSGYKLLDSYKKLASDLLPALRNRSHLHNLTFSKTSTTLVMTRAEAQGGNGTDEAIGGVTFRMYKAGTDAVILDVLTLCTKQSKSICGHGYGTRMVNFLKVR